MFPSALGARKEGEDMILTIEVPVGYTVKLVANGDQLEVTLEPP